MASECDFDEAIEELEAPTFRYFDLWVCLEIASHRSIWG